ncbi:MAG: hypothetical protein JO301_00085 [Chitinophagaceae bacterium]|nr:hypothetical protein [Chitinophagaceae bacterium]
MKCNVSAIVCVLISVCAEGQLTSDRISIAIPVIWNNTTITNVIGPRRQISGNGISTGLEISYNHPVSKDLFAIGGIGYFNQVFGINRPVDYSVSIYQPFYTTSGYSYQCIELIAGLGYQGKTHGGYFFTGDITYHYLHSIRQKYPVKNPEPPQINRKSISFGHMLDVSTGINRIVSSKVSVGCGLVVPVIMRLRKDAIFEENTKESYTPSIAVGLTLSLHYRL